MEEEVPWMWRWIIIYYYSWLRGLNLSLQPLCNLWTFLSKNRCSFAESKRCPDGFWSLPPGIHPSYSPLACDCCLDEAGIEFWVRPAHGPLQVLVEMIIPITSYLASEFLLLPFFNWATPLVLQKSWAWFFATNREIGHIMAATFFLKNTYITSLSLSLSLSPSLSIYIYWYCVAYPKHSHKQGPHHDASRRSQLAEDRSDFLFSDPGRLDGPPSLES